MNKVEKWGIKLTELQTIRWNDTGSMNIFIINYTTIFYSNYTDQHQLRTGFAIHKRIVSAFKSSEVLT